MHLLSVVQILFFTFFTCTSVQNHVLITFGYAFVNFLHGNFNNPAGNKWEVKCGRADEGKVETGESVGGARLGGGGGNRVQGHLVDR